MYVHRGANVLCCATEARFPKVAVVCLCPGKSLRWAQHRTASCPGVLGSWGYCWGMLMLSHWKGWSVEGWDKLLSEGAVCEGERQQTLGVETSQRPFQPELFQPEFPVRFGMRALLPPAVGLHLADGAVPFCPSILDLCKCKFPVLNLPACCWVMLKVSLLC